MRLGSALAVIQFNDGYRGIKEVFEAVGITPGAYLSETFNNLDKERVNRSKYIIRNQKRRFAKKQRRGKKVKSQIQKHGPGYESGKYTSGQPDIDNEAEDEQPSPTSSQDPLTSTTSLAHSCDICGYTEGEGIAGFGIGLTLPPGDIEWVQCATCLKWFHLLCLGVEEEDLPEGDWKCAECRK